MKQRDAYCFFIGFVTEVAPDSFWARLGERDDKREEFEAEFPYANLPESQRGKVELGRFLVWRINGRNSQIRFLP